MDKADTDRYRERLVALREQILQLQASSKESTRPVELDQASVGRVSRIDAIQAQQMARETDRRRVSRLAKIDGALRRIESGDFGLCFACGEEIDARRLAADPTSTRCMACLEG